MAAHLLLFCKVGLWAWGVEGVCLTAFEVASILLPRAMRAEWSLGAIGGGSWPLVFNPTRSRNFTTRWGIGAFDCSWSIFWRNLLERRLGMTWSLLLGLWSFLCRCLLGRGGGFCLVIDFPMMSSKVKPHPEWRWRRRAPLVATLGYSPDDSGKTRAGFDACRSSQWHK